MNCKELASKIKQEIKEQVLLLDNDPVLAVIVVGDNPASKTYIQGKRKDCLECGIHCEVYHFDEEITTSELRQFIHKLNDDDDVNGILVQLPLPDTLDEKEILGEISILKDVDGFREENLGRLLTENPFFVPCTPAGIMKILNEFNIEIDGKRCVVIGRSNIVGKPMSLILTNAGGTVTLCHSHTKDLAEITRQADIIVCAVGKEKFLTADMVKDGVAVIDVGINRDENGKLCGDVDFENVSKKCSAITPVPNGVGLMTRVALLSNLVFSCHLSHYL